MGVLDRTVVIMSYLALFFVMMLAIALLTGYTSLDEIFEES